MQPRPISRAVAEKPSFHDDQRHRAANSELANPNAAIRKPKNVESALVPVRPAQQPDLQHEGPLDGLRRQNPRRSRKTKRRKKLEENFRESPGEDRCAVLASVAESAQSELD